MGSLNNNSNRFLTLPNSQVKSPSFFVGTGKVVFIVNFLALNKKCFRHLRYAGKKGQPAEKKHVFQNN